MFVDESGSFQDDDPSLLTGLLLERCPDALAARLRRRLIDIWGSGPWPPHACDLRFPAARVLYGLYERRDDMPEGRLMTEARSSIRELAASLAAGRMGARVAEITAGSFPTWQDCQQADILLARHPRYGLLRKVAEDQERAMGKLIADLCAQAGGTVVAVEADREAAGEAPAGLKLRDDPYVRALKVMARRVARLAGRQPVEWHVLSRGVEVGGLGRVQMQGHFVNGILSAAAQATGGRAIMEAGHTTLRYRDSAETAQKVHPALVIADWLANRLRMRVTQHGGTYAALEAVCAGCVPQAGLLRRVPVDAALLGALPSVAAAGEPDNAIEQAFAGTPAAALTGASSPTGWQWEQAKVWADAAGRWP